MIALTSDCPAPVAPGERGFTFIEVMIAAALLAVSLLSMCAVFVVAYSNLGAGGRDSVGVAVSEQLLEDVRGLPFDAVTTLDNFNTDSSGTLPAADPAREIARRWRYALAGEGVGWTFTTAEKARWTNMNGAAGPIGAVGTIDVTAMSTSLSEITVSVAVPGRWKPVVLVTRVARL